MATSRGAHLVASVTLQRGAHALGAQMACAVRDVPKITVHMQDMPDRGVIGIGEPPTISTAAAIGNAIFNAIGVRVPDAPYTPERVLAALANRK